ncbi:hypothetical protein ZRA01_21560 [Zoogloea ramigera]|uniref:Uncharacterized protein n=1 Tax=Zoogloea ramigera TaxID=350 RepID=A0A4Y4CXR1_ZOORA|nr:hypothetical protein ZRA01_21560 [Zoogloea ramigera]
MNKADMEELLVTGKDVGVVARIIPESAPPGHLATAPLTPRWPRRLHAGAAPRQPPHPPIHGGRHAGTKVCAARCRYASHPYTRLPGGCEWQTTARHLPAQPAPAMPRSHLPPTPCGTPVVAQPSPAAEGRRICFKAAAARRVTP